MANDYNFYNLEAPFKLFLVSGNKKISPISIANYISDLRHFFGWIVLTIKNSELPINFSPDDYQQIFSQFLTKEIIAEYTAYLKENFIPLGTINRRLSTLRKFCAFCISQGWLKANPAKQIANISRTNTRVDVMPIAHEQNKDSTAFLEYLSKYEPDLSRIKLIISDVEEFLGFSNGLKSQSHDGKS